MLQVTCHPTPHHLHTNLHEISFYHADFSKVLHHRWISTQPAVTTDNSLLSLWSMTFTYWHFFTFEQLFNDNSFPCIAELPLHTTAHKALRLWLKMKYKQYTQNKTKQTKSMTKTWFRDDRNMTQAPQLSCTQTVRCSCHLKCHVFMHALILNSHEVTLQTQTTLSLCTSTWYYTSLFVYFVPAWPWTQNHSSSSAMMTNTRAHMTYYYHLQLLYH